MATAAPPSRIECTWPAKTRPPLELQLLPPSPFAASESPWGVDPSRLQQLMMGTSAASSPAPTHSTDLGTLFDERVSFQPLPSGWERCLDLQSGKVFLKQSCDGASRALQRPCKEQGKDEKPGSSRGPEVSSPRLNVEQRQDWSLRWLEGDLNIEHGGAAAVNNKSSSISSFKHGVDNDTPTFLIGEPLCLDLDLRLTNGKRSKPSINIQGEGVPLSLAPHCAAANMNMMAQSWKWQQQAGPSTTGEKSSNPPVKLEMVKECSMVTAVCTKCLMFVLLRRSKAECPRCSLPIILEGAPTSNSVSRKRERSLLEREVDCWEL